MFLSRLADGGRTRIWTGDWASLFCPDGPSHAELQKTYMRRIDYLTYLWSSELSLRQGPQAFHTSSTQALLCTDSVDLGYPFAFDICLEKTPNSGNRFRCRQKGVRFLIGTSAFGHGESQYFEWWRRRPRIWCVRPLVPIRKRT